MQTGRSVRAALFFRPFTVEQYCDDIMEPPGIPVDPNFTCAGALNAMAATQRRCMAVVAKGRLEGLITTGDFSRLNGRDPRRTRLSAIMTPARELLTLVRETLAIDALKTLEESGYHQIPVVTATRRLEGFITREVLMGLRTWQR